MSDRDEARIACIVRARSATSSLPTLLDGLAWADERWVVDEASHADSVRFARLHGATVRGPSEGHDTIDAINQCLDEASGEWVIFLEANESLANDAEDELHRLIDLHGDHFDAFEIPRLVRIGGEGVGSIDASGGCPGGRVRLFRRNLGRWHGASGRLLVDTPAERRLRLDAPGCLLIQSDFPTFRDFVAERFADVLADTAAPKEFAFEDYVARAYEQLAAVNAEEDGELAHAVATVRAWEEVLGGLLHWDHTGRSVPLAPLFSLPIVTRPDAAPRGLLERLVARWRDAGARR